MMSEQRHKFVKTETYEGHFKSNVHDIIMAYSMLFTSKARSTQTFFKLISAMSVLLCVSACAIVGIVSEY